MKTYIALLTLCVLGLTSAACSVRQDQVVNQPPTFNDVVNFTVTHGTLTPESITIFYWPTGLNEEQAQAVVRTANTAANKIDVLTGEVAKIKMAQAQQEAEFAEKACVAEFAAASTKVEVDENKRTFDWVTQWKAIDAADSRSAVLGLCQNNQATRGKLMEKLKTEIRPQFVTQVQAFQQAVGLSNFVQVSPKGSSLVIKTPEQGSTVEVTLADFVRKGQAVSTQTEGPTRIQKAQYIPARKLLVFAVPELDEAGNPTGQHFQFALERTPDFLGNARFSGDVKLMRGTEIIRYGSAKFEGTLKN